MKQEQNLRPEGRGVVKFGRAKKIHGAGVEMTDAERAAVCFSLRKSAAKE